MALIFDPLVKKIHNKTVAWKGKLLSQGGPYVLSCMASHTLAVSPVPKKVIKKFNANVFTFFWGEVNNKWKRKWGAWSKICKPIEEGGAWIRDIYARCSMSLLLHEICMAIDDSGEFVDKIFFALNTSKIAI